MHQNIKKMRILVCDNDLSLATVLTDYLISRGYDADPLTDGKKVLSDLRNAHFDLLLFDVQQEGMNGFQMLREIRRDFPFLPIIVLTAKTDRESQIRAFQLGCDDYQFKPFTMDILICRIEAIMRRVRTQEESRQKIFTLGELTFKSIHHTLGDKHLSGRMSDLLLLLCRRQDSLVEQHFILSELWKEDNAFTARSLHVFINHLRVLLKPTGFLILNVRNRGYKLVQSNT